MLSNSINKYRPIVDTCIWINLFTKQQRVHPNFLQSGAYINCFILCELLNYLQNKYSHHESLKAQNTIIKLKENIKFISETNKNHQAAISLRQKYYDNKYTYTDCIILAQAQNHGLKVYTTDIKMQSYPDVEFVYQDQTRNL